MSACDKSPVNQSIFKQQQLVVQCLDRWWMCYLLLTFVFRLQLTFPHRWVLLSAFWIWTSVSVRLCVWEGENESWMRTNSPWLMKAAGPSQSWAQRLRVEYITLKSLTPALSTALSEGLSSAMQPSRTSTRSPTNLQQQQQWSRRHISESQRNAVQEMQLQQPQQLMVGAHAAWINTMWLITSALLRLFLLHWSLRSICHRTRSWYRCPTGRHWGTDTPAHKTSQTVQTGLRL